MKPHESDLPDDDDDDPRDALPDGTERVINRNGSMTALVDDRWWDPEFAEAMPEGVDRPEKAVFDEGDAIPVDLAGICWSAMKDSFEAQDGNGETLYRGRHVDRNTGYTQE